MIKGSLVVDRALRGVPVEKLLDARRAGARGRPSGVASSKDDSPLLAEGEKLRPGRLYKAAKDPTARYYVPKYRVAQDDENHPQVQLRHDPADGEVGRLTVTLEWDQPNWTKGELRRMDHHVALSLRTRIPVQGGDVTKGLEEVIDLQPASIVTSTRSESVTPISDAAQFTAIYHAMRDRDRGTELQLSITAEVGVRTWKQVVKERPRAKDQLGALERRDAMFTKMVKVDPKVTARALGPGRTAVALRPTDSAAAMAALPSSALLGLDRSVLTRAISAGVLGTLAVTPPAGASGTGPQAGGNASASRAGAPTPAATGASGTARASTERATINPEAAAALRSTLVSRMGPTMFRTAATPAAPAAAAPSAIAMAPLLRMAVTQPATPSGSTPQPAARPPATPAAAMPSAAIAMAARPGATSLSAAIATDRGVSAALSRHLANDVSMVARARPELLYSMAASPSVLEMIAAERAPSLREAVTKTTVQVGTKKVVPAQLVLDKDKQPAVIDTELTVEMKEPFVFDAVEHPDVYVGEATSTAPRLLVARTVVDEAGRTTTVYQDSLDLQVVYVPPSGFRLFREQNAPFTPSIAFVASDFGTVAEGAENTAEVFLRVAIVYRLEPYVEPDLTRKVTAMLAAEGLAAVVSPIMPTTSVLKLFLSELSEEEKTRSEAVVDLTTGITDTLELDFGTFQTVWGNYLMGDPSTGIRGAVEFTLFDGTQVRSSVRIALGETSPEIMDTIPRGPAADAPDQHEVVIRNRIESPAELEPLLPIMLAGGGIAKPVETGAGVTLGPAEERTFRYLVQGGEPIAYLDPVVMARPDPVFATLLGMLMVTTGYASLGFGLEVRAVEGAFGTGAGAEPVTGLLVEFDDGTTVELNPELPSTEIMLLGRLADRLIGDADDQQRYFYRVTNLHATGEGARTSWTEGRGEAALDVGTAQVTLGF